MCRFGITCSCFLVFRIRSLFVAAVSKEELVNTACGIVTNRTFTITLSCTLKRIVSPSFRIMFLVNLPEFHPDIHDLVAMWGLD
jgi:hypothetical protein